MSHKTESWSTPFLVVLDRQLKRIRRRFLLRGVRNMVGFWCKFSDRFKNRFLSPFFHGSIFAIIFTNPTKNVQTSSSCIQRAEKIKIYVNWSKARSLHSINAGATRSLAGAYRFFTLIMMSKGLK